MFWVLFWTFEHPFILLKKTVSNFFNLLAIFGHFCVGNTHFSLIGLIYVVNPEIHPKSGNLAKFKIFVCYDHCTLVVDALFLINLRVSGEENFVLTTMDAVFVSLTLLTLSLRILHYHMGSSHISGGGWHRVDMSVRRFSVQKTIALRGKQHHCSFFETLDNRVSIAIYKNATQRWCFHVKRTIYDTESCLLRCQPYVTPTQVGMT